MGATIFHRGTRLLGGKRTRVPAVLHVSHPKSGSTWITRILKQLARDRFVRPWGDMRHLEEPLEPGAVYPRVYLRREEVEALTGGDEALVTLSIRDLRDTLVSGYWSLRESHKPRGAIPRLRAELIDRSVEDGMLWMLDNWLPNMAAIQLSWVGFEPTLRYEEMLADDLGVLVPELSGRLGLGTPEQVEAAVRACRFEQASGGRERGSEDRGSHHRKGIAGDWRNYMSDGPLHAAFKERYGEHLVLTGYETSEDW